MTKEEARERTPGQKLWYSVLGQAILDASLPAQNGKRCYCCNLNGDNADHRMRCPYFMKSQALNWFRANTPNKLGAFAWVCHVLDFDTQKIRGLVYRYLSSHRKRVDYDREYNATEEGKARNRRYASTGKSRARNRRYDHSAKGRARQQRYRTIVGDESIEWFG